MAKKKGVLEGAKKTVLVFISGIAFLVFLWLLFYGKIKASAILSPLLGKVPKDEAGVMKVTEDVLGTTIKKIKEGEAKKLLQKGSEFFETSQYAAPARDARDEVKNRLNETIESAKGLPAKEIKYVQRQVCTEWLGEEIIASQSGER